MCFSASASFGASAVLGIVGAVTVKKAINSSQFLFACIPLLFCLQQLCEGFVWLSVMNPDFAGRQSVFIQLFLFFAYALWPVWIPLSILLIEKNKKRKQLLRLLLATGAVVAVYVIACLLLYPVTVLVSQHHLSYTFNYPLVLLHLVTVRDGLYFLATLLAAFLSTHKRMWMFGTLLIAAYLFSRIFFKDTVASVWCYFAAVLSIVVVFIIQRRRFPISALQNCMTRVKAN